MASEKRHLDCFFSVYTSFTSVAGKSHVSIKMKMKAVDDKVDILLALGIDSRKIKRFPP